MEQPERTAIQHIYLPVHVWMQTLKLSTRKCLKDLEVGNAETFYREFDHDICIDEGGLSLDILMGRYDRLLGTLTKISKKDGLSFFTKTGIPVPMSKSEDRKRQKYFQARLIDPINKLRKLAGSYCAVVYALDGIVDEDMRVLVLPDGYLDILWQPHNNERQLAIMEALRQ